MNTDRIETIIAIGTLIVLVGCTVAFWFMIRVLL